MVQGPFLAWGGDCQGPDQVANEPRLHAQLLCHGQLLRPHRAAPLHQHTKNGQESSLKVSQNGLIAKTADRKKQNDERLYFSYLGASQ